MFILNLEQHLKRVPFGDMPSHPALIGTCFTFINFSITEFGLGYLETYPPTPSYVGTCYFINNHHHGYGSNKQNPFHRSPFARPHTVSHTVGHKHYMVSLSSDLRLSWFWFIHKPTLHRSPFARPQTAISQLVISITEYLYPQIFVHHGYGLTTQNPSLQWLFIFNKGFSGGNFT